LRENTRGKYTTIVIPTLLRESIFKTMPYIRQYTEAEVIPYYDPTVNEYVVRNLVAEGVTTPYISFIDDDAYPSTNWYQNLLRNIRKGCDIITGYVYSNGRFFGQAYHAIGTNLTVKTEVFRRLGGFEEDWGNPKFGNAGYGWRSDTDLLWRYLESGGDNYCHDDGLLVYHPKPFSSEFILPIEIEFIKRHKPHVVKYFYDIDPRVVIVNDVFIDGKVSDKLLEWYKNARELTLQMWGSVMLSAKKYGVKVNVNVDEFLKELNKLSSNPVTTNTTKNVSQTK